MKKILLALIFAVQSLIGTEVIAAPLPLCVTGSLSSYTALGSGGCTIGSFQFSNFVLLPLITGATSFASLIIAPVTVGTSAVGLDFRVNATAGPNVFFDNLISYRVTGLGASINGASLFISGTSPIGDATATAVENLCLAGRFAGLDGVTGCTGMPVGPLVVTDFGGFADLPSVPDPTMSLDFPSASSLAVVTDIGLDGGIDGTGSDKLAFAGNRFFVAPAAVPEPASILLIVAGLLVLFGYRAARPLRASRLL